MNSLQLRTTAALALLTMTGTIAHAGSTAPTPAYTYALLSQQRGVVDVQAGVQPVVGPRGARYTLPPAHPAETPVLELIKPEPAPPVVRHLELVGFGDSRSVLTPAQGALLSAHMPALSRATHVRLVGHTDARGSDAFNDGLGSHRAAAVSSVLGGQQVTIESAESAGEKSPIADNDTAVGRAINRRVTLEYTTQK